MSLCTEKSKESFEKKIIIVGAGIAGLACGFRLKELGFTNVTILEARNRVGGRLETIHFGDDFIEMGAQWIHGQEGNIIYELASANKLVNKSASDYASAIMNFSTVQSKSECEISNALLEFLDDKIDNICDGVYSDLSVLSYLNKHFKDFIAQKGAQSHLEHLKKIYDWYCKLLCELNGCSSLSYLSRRLLDNYKECDGLQTVELKSGYSSILNLFLQKIPSSWLHKCKKVEKIDLSDFKMINSPVSYANKEKPKIEVFCEDGENYIAEHVVVTVPLGYLKKHVNSLFVPALSERKQRAIQHLGFDVINKIYLEFDKPFWEDETIFNVLLPDSFDEILMKNVHSKEEVAKKSWVKYINRFAYTPSHPKMLCAWVVSEGASIMESLPDDEISRQSMKLLELILEMELPAPRRVLRSSWLSDPYTCGSYSYLSVDCEKEKVSHVDVAEPEYSATPCSKHPVLLFAGEATHSSYFSTVHGACESGYREAERLFNHYGCDKACGIYETTSYGFDNMKNKNNIRNILKILIIGAGLAGLTCGLTLSKNNFSQVTIVEAQKAIGGRISSVKYNGCIFDLGAQWIHGMDNPLYEFSKEHNLLSYSSEDFSYEGKGKFCISSGDEVKESIVEEVKTVLDDVKAELDEGKHENSDPSKPVFNFFLEAFKRYMDTCCDDSIRAIKWGLFHWYMKFEVVDNSCDDLNSVSNRSYSDWTDCSEEFYHINFKKGFNSVIDTIYHQLPHNTVLVNKPVKQVRWCENFTYEQHNNFFNCRRSFEDFPVTVKCEDEEEILVDSVIVTTSAGFLKENIDTFFSPSLPESKTNAFQTLGFGTINKIFLIYDEPFWTESDLGFQLVWIKDDADFCRLVIENPWIRGITGFDTVQKQQNVLLGWIGGVEAKMIEDVEEENICIVCTKLLRMFLKRSDIPYPVQVFRSSWHKNPYIKGAYSNRSLEFYKCGATVHDLQYPLCSTFITEKRGKVQWPTVIFAGEATDEHSFSSAHGAFQSGLKAAQCLNIACSQIEDCSELI